MWLISEFEAVTLFSLRMSTATASGGKTLLAPTPYAVKMALLDVACRMNGVRQAEKQWEAIRELRIALSPAPRAVVTNLFQKVLRPRRNPVPMDEADAGFFQRTIGYREYVQLDGRMGLAFGWAGDEERRWLAELLTQITYFGKRGSFMQLVVPPFWVDELPDGYTELTQEAARFVIGGTLQLLDDCSPDLTFEKANIYSGKSIRLGKERILRSIVLPYRVAKSSRSFTLYERADL
ncbi:MAG: hypothetical protein GX491_15950 [Chloroflexi bacterium]|nr:hypothetical protein [Chloroflexota bacterium]